MKRSPTTWYALVGWLFTLLKDTCLRVPTRLRIERISSYFDGGTIDIIGRDEHGHRRRIRLTQQMFEPDSWGDMPVGRLYLGWRRVPMRGRAEAAVLDLVERLLKEEEAARPANAESGTTSDWEAHNLRLILEYVRSASYGQVL